MQSMKSIEQFLHILLTKRANRSGRTGGRADHDYRKAYFLPAPY